MSIIIKEKNKEIIKKIERAVRLQIYRQLQSRVTLIKLDIVKQNLDIWKQTDTYHSLIHGDLTHEFGIPKGSAQTRVDNILNAFARSIEVIPKLSDRRKAGRYILLNLNIFPLAIKQWIFNMDEAIVITKKASTNPKHARIIRRMKEVHGIENAVAQKLPWLRWLLQRGNEYVIYNHTYRPVSSERSRSGKGLMFNTPGDHWKVPAEHSGTRNSNWLTRALRDNEQFLISQYTLIIEKHLKDA